MLSTTMHRVLANSSDKFVPAVFSHLGFREKAAAALDQTGKWEKRKRALGALVRITLVVFLPLYRSLSIQNVLKKVLNLLREIEPGLSLVAVTPEAVCHGRKRLGVEPLALLFDAFAVEVRPAASFLGLRTWGYDGVRFTLPDTPLNVTAYGRPKASRGKAAFPQMLAVALVDTQSHQIRDVAMGRCTDSERELARKFVPHLGAKDLVMKDRGCSSVGQFAAFMSNGTHVLGRIAKSWKPKKIRQLSDGSWLVQIEGYDDTGSKKAKQDRQRRKKGVVGRRKRKGGQRKTAGTNTRRLIVLQMRMIEYQVGRSEKCRLLTDLLDPEKFPALELAREYHRRWECELTYDELKTHLSTVPHGTLHTVFRSKTPDGVKQEAYGTFITYNLIRRLMVEAGETHGVPPLEISFVGTVEAIKDAAPRFEAVSSRRRDVLIRQLLEDIAACRNARPRRPRWNPREVKIKMSNSRLKRRRGRGKTIDFAADLRVKPPASPRRRATRPIATSGKTRNRNGNADRGSRISVQAMSDTRPKSAFRVSHSRSCSTLPSARRAA